MLYIFPWMYWKVKLNSCLPREVVEALCWWRGKDAWGQGYRDRLRTPRIEGAACFQKLDPREAEARRHLPTLVLIIAPRLQPCASHSFPSWSQSHLLSLKATGGANMYVMNILSPERGFAREL